jgi:hypothetical protein
MANVRRALGVGMGLAWRCPLGGFFRMLRNTAGEQPGDGSCEVTITINLVTTLCVALLAMGLARKRKIRVSRLARKACASCIILSFSASKS